MSIYKTQAQRVIDYIVQDSQIPESALNETLKINIDFIEKRIINMVQQKLGNGKEAADLLIDQWKRAHPDYIKNAYSITFMFQGLEYRFKVLDNEFHIYFEPPHGAFLHNIQTAFINTDEFKEAACSIAFQAYQEKVKTMQL